MTALIGATCGLVVCAAVIGIGYAVVAWDFGQRCFCGGCEN